MTKNTLYFLQQQYKQQLVQVNLTFPTSNEAVLQLMEDALKQQQSLGKPVALTVIDHISSVPAILFPVDDITALCHRYKSLVMIDGAHALGHVPVNMQKTDAEFWFGNAHKWLYSPKGSAILWVKKEMQSRVFPTTLSDEGIGATQFQMEFSWVGTQDYTPYLAVEQGLKFRESLGGDEPIMTYMHQLAVEGGQYLASRWKTDLLIAPEMTGAMVNVRTPSFNATPAEVSLALMNQYNTFVPVYPLPVDPTTYYVRVSAQIFNDMTDFQFLADAVLQLSEQFNSAHHSGNTNKIDITEILQ